MYSDNEMPSRQSSWSSVLLMQMTQICRHRPILMLTIIINTALFYSQIWQQGQILWRSIRTKQGCCYVWWSGNAQYVTQLYILMTQLHRWHSYTDDPVIQMSQLYRWPSYTDDTVIQMTQLYRWHSFTDDTVTQMTQLHRWHNFTDYPVAQMTQLHRWHSYIDDPVTQMTQLYRWHSCTDDTVVQSTQLYRWYSCIWWHLYRWHSYTWWHSCTDDTVILMTQLHSWHRYTDDTVAQMTPLNRWPNCTDDPIFTGVLLIIQMTPVQFMTPILHFTKCSIMYCRHIWQHNYAFIKVNKNKPMLLLLMYVTMKC